MAEFGVFQSSRKHPKRSDEDDLFERRSLAGSYLLYLEVIRLVLNCEFRRRRPKLQMLPTR
jgi:hypothetical protein